MIRTGWGKFIAVWSVIAVIALSIVAADMLSWFDPARSEHAFTSIAPVAAGAAIGATLMAIFGLAKRHGE
jgi:amino acid transporter